MDTEPESLRQIMDGRQSKSSQSSTSDHPEINLMEVAYRRTGPPGYEHCDWNGVRNASVAADVFGRLFSPANPSPRFPVYLTGDVGRGKTGLAAVLFRIAKRPIWRRADSFLLDLSMGRSDETYRQEIRKASDASLLVLDDLGVRKPSEGMFHLLFDVLELRKTKPTIITSNKTLDELCDLYTDGRIYSRLAAGTIMMMTGDDRRLADGSVTVFQI